MKRLILLSPHKKWKNRLIMASKTFNWERIGLSATNLKQLKARVIRGLSVANGPSSRHLQQAKSPSFKRRLRWAKALRGLATLKILNRGIKVFQTDIILLIPWGSGRRRIFLSKFQTLKLFKARIQITMNPDLMRYRLVLPSPPKQSSQKGSKGNSRSIMAIWKAQKTATSQVEMLHSWAKSPSFSRRDLIHLRCRVCLFKFKGQHFLSARLRSFVPGMNWPI